ncbi:Prolyl endopeptidase [Bienertia sinuspersici]
MEDPDSEETKEFVNSQVEVTESLLKTCETREKLKERLKEVFEFERFQDSLDGDPKVLLDPNELSKDGTVSLHICEVSEDAQYLAYGLSTSGSDWITIKVISVADQAPLSDTLSWVKFSNVAWTHDNAGFFYSRYPAPKGEIADYGTETNINLNHELYYHALGTEQSEDILCWKDVEHPRYRFYPQVTDDGKYLLLHIEENCEDLNKLYYLNLSSLPNNSLRSAQNTNGLLPFTKLIDELDALYHYIANDDTHFIFLTNKNAPRCKLVRVDLNHPNLWTDTLPESEKDVLVSVEVANGNRLIVCYLRDVKHVLEIRDLHTGAFLHQLPIDIGTVRVSARRKDSVAFVSFTSFLTFNITYHCDLAGEVFAPSKDGTKIPMFIVSRKDIVLDKSNPCLLFAYGGFNVSLTPGFSVIRTTLLKHLGAIFCVANIRGGGEYGEEWHKAGSLDKKQNCFDDFIAAAEFLVSNGYTQPSKLCIEGHAWTADFGCSDKEEDFHWLIKYSPLHNVSRPWENSSGRYVQYPATMLLTADHDDRVVPLHSLKLLAVNYAVYTLYKLDKESTNISNSRKD